MDSSGAMSMNPFSVSQGTQCVCSRSFCSSSGQGLLSLCGALSPSASSPSCSSAPGVDSHLAGPCPGSLQLRPPGGVQLGLLQTISGKWLQICATFISTSRSQDTFCPELLLSTCWPFFQLFWAGVTHAGYRCRNNLHGNFEQNPFSIFQIMKVVKKTFWIVKRIISSFGNAAIKWMMLKG